MTIEPRQLVGQSVILQSKHHHKNHFTTKTQFAQTINSVGYHFIGFSYHLPKNKTKNDTNKTKTNKCKKAKAPKTPFPISPKKSSNEKDEMENEKRIPICFCFFLLLFSHHTVNMIRYINTFSFALSPRRLRE